MVMPFLIVPHPIPIQDLKDKRSMKLLGYCGDELRLPLCPISESNEKILVAALKNYGLPARGGSLPVRQAGASGGKVKA